jgi:hypothetical protein
VNQQSPAHRWMVDGNFPVLGGSLIFQRTACSGCLFKNTESKNWPVLVIWKKSESKNRLLQVFLKPQRTIGFHERTTGWLLVKFFAKSIRRWVFQIWPSPVICQYIYSNLWWGFGLVLCGSFFEKNLQSHFWHLNFFWRFSQWGFQPGSSFF